MSHWSRRVTLVKVRDRNVTGIPPEPGIPFQERGLAGICRNRNMQPSDRWLQHSRKDFANLAVFRPGIGAALQGGSFGQVLTHCQAVKRFFDSNVLLDQVHKEVQSRKGKTTKQNTKEHIVPCLHEVFTHVQLSVPCAACHKGARRKTRKCKHDVIEVRKSFAIPGRKYRKEAITADAGVSHNQHSHRICSPKRGSAPILFCAAEREMI